MAEINEKVWPLARTIGANNVVKDVREFAEEKLDVIADFAGFGDTTAAAVDIIRPGGWVVIVVHGQAGKHDRHQVADPQQCNLVGSMGGDVSDVQGVYDFFAAGKLNPTITTTEALEISPNWRGARPPKRERSSGPGAVVPLTVTAIDSFGVRFGLAGFRHSSRGEECPKNRVGFGFHDEFRGSAVPRYRLGYRPGLVIRLERK